MSIEVKLGNKGQSTHYATASSVENVAGSGATTLDGAIDASVGAVTPINAASNGWNRTKNVLVDDNGIDVTDPVILNLDQFVHVDINLAAQDEDVEANVSNAKRGNMVFGSGDDDLNLTLVTNGKGWSNQFFIEMGEGDDEVTISEGEEQSRDDDNAKTEAKITDGRFTTVTAELGEGDDTYTNDTQAVDIVNGGNGSDIIRTGAGDDIVVGGNGGDQIFGGEGDDTLSGGGNKDLLEGGQGNDTLNGGNNRDVLRGGEGEDVLNGQGSNDQLFGGTGDDILNGGGGDDMLTGGEDGSSNSGSGNTQDRNTFIVGQGNDVITDFDLNGGGETSFDTLVIEGVSAVLDAVLETKQDFLDYVETIETDGDVTTDAIRNGDDLILAFERDGGGTQAPITDSVTLQDFFATDDIAESDFFKDLDSFVGDGFAA